MPQAKAPLGATSHMRTRKDCRVIPLQRAAPCTGEKARLRPQLAALQAGVLPGRKVGILHRQRRQVWAGMPGRQRLVRGRQLGGKDPAAGAVAARALTAVTSCRRLQSARSCSAGCGLAGQPVSATATALAINHTCEHFPLECGALQGHSTPAGASALFERRAASGASRA